MPANKEFMSDILWLHATYYFGLHYQTDKKYPLLDDYIENMTELSPKRRRPYHFAAVNFPLELGKVDLALKYIDKGLENHPRDWKLWFFKGIYLYQFKKDYDAASRAMSKASKIPEAPDYLTDFSFTLASKSERNILTRKFLQEVLEDIEDAKRRRSIINKFKELRDESASSRLE